MKLKNKANSKFIVLFLFSVYFLIGIFTFKDYGISIDEQFQRSSGLYWLSYILKLLHLDKLSAVALLKFENIQGFTLVTADQIPTYGIIFDVPSALIEIIFSIDEPKNYFYLRHLMNFLFFFISSIYFYRLLVNRFENINLCILGTIFYILSPRIYGASFYNNKDIIFLSVVSITIYFLFKYFDEKNLKNLILFSIFSAICTSTRMIGIFFPISFLLIIFLSNLNNKKEFEIIKIFMLYITLYLFFLFIHWPYLWTAPLENLLSIFYSSSKLLIEYTIFFNGEYIKSNFLPFWYIPTWISISTPPLYLLLFIFGYFYILKRFFLRFINLKENSNYPDFWRGTDEIKDFLIFFNLTIIFLYLILFNITLYNGWRHIYFFNAFIIYIATYGLYIFFSKFKTQKSVNRINFFVIIFLSITTFKMIIHHPFQNIYFSSLLTQNFKKKFEVDYMALSGANFLNRILILEKDKKLINIGVASYSPIERSLVLLDEKDAKKINIVGQEYKKAEYIYTNNISEVNKNYDDKYTIPINFKKIDELVVDGTKVFEIYKNLNK